MTPHFNGTAGALQKCEPAKACGQGLILPEWLQSSAPTSAVFQAICYIILMAYLLFGVSIIADRIVASIEVIATQKRAKTIKLKTGRTKVIQASLWNHTVLMLTVSAIGMSPEILLAIVDAFRKDFEAHELGSSVILGTGAYHLLFTAGICMLSGQETVTKPIKSGCVFYTEVACAVLAYFWLEVVLTLISPGVVEIWEALLTVGFCPVFVVLIWVVSKRYPNKIFSRLIPMRQYKSTVLLPLTEQTSLISASEFSEELGYPSESSLEDDAIDEEAKRRRTLSEILIRLKVAYPDKSRFELEEMAQLKMLEDTPKTMLFYRMQTIRRFSGAGDIISKAKIKEKLSQQRSNVTSQKTGFMATYQTCEENCGSVGITVGRWGVGIDETELKVDYVTIEGKAKENHHYVPISGTLIFHRGEQFANVSIQIIDDDVYEARTKTFKLKLSNPKVEWADCRKQDVELVINEIVIMIIDDDHCGAFTFETSEKAIPDDIGTAKIRIVRGFGSKGFVALPYKINPGTAIPGEDYIAVPKGILHFSEGQSEDFIDIKIIDKNRVGEIFTFYIELLQPQSERQPVQLTIVRPTLGDHKVIQIAICENEEMKEALQRLLKITDLADLSVSATWSDQLRDALTLVVDEEDYYHSGDQMLPLSPWKARKTIIVHYIALPWKFLVALMPPARFLNGWLAYLSLLVFMGFVTILTGDFAYALGCTTGLKDVVTAVTLIAFGLGVSDTVACHQATLYEKTADAAIGHLTSANTVSVFLGIGLSWTIGAVRQAAVGEQLKINPSSFTFSTMIYCIFAILAIAVLLARRFSPSIRGELGGPFWLKVISSAFFISLWCLFGILTILQSYCLLF